MPKPVTYTARLKVREYLDAHGVSAYQLVLRAARRTGGATLGRNAIYGLAANRSERIDLSSLAALAGLVTEATGQPVQVQDLIDLSTD